MSDIIFKIEKQDIVTSRLGKNFLLQCETFKVIITYEALDELVSDFCRLKTVEEVIENEENTIINNVAAKNDQKACCQDGECQCNKSSEE